MAKHRYFPLRRNLLINLFGGPVVNAARAIANQVLHAVHGFVDNFYMAIRPQITKSYASGNWEYMMTLIYQGSKLSYYMLLLLCLPILLNTEYLLHLWLNIVPDHAVLFVQLTLVFTMIESISGPLITAQLATGKIRNYQLVVGGLQMANLPVSYIFLKNGAMPEILLYVAIFFSVCCLASRLYMLRDMINLHVMGFLRNVVCNVLFVSIVSATIPLVIKGLMPENFVSFFVMSLLSVTFTILSVLFVGCKKDERQLIRSHGKKFLLKMKSYMCNEK